MNIINNIRTIDINCINNNNETLFLGYASDINSVQLHFILEPELSSIDYNYRIVFYKNDTDETISDNINYNDGIYYIIPAGITHISNTNAGHKGFLQLFVMQGNGNDATMIASSNKFPYIIENSLNLSAVPVEDLPNGLWEGLEAAVAKINGFTLDTSELHDSDSYIPTSKFLKTLIDNNVTYEFILQSSINNATNPEKIYIVRHGSGTAGSMIGWLIYIGPKSGVTASSGQTQWYFGLDGELRYRYRVDDNSSWGAWFYIENTKNKKNTIERDTSQYPSSLAIYDALNEKESLGNKKDVINNRATEYPSSKAVYDALTNKQSISKITISNINAAIDVHKIYEVYESKPVSTGWNNCLGHVIFVCQDANLATPESPVNAVQIWFTSETDISCAPIKYRHATVVDGDSPDMPVIGSWDSSWTTIAENVDYITNIVAKGSYSSTADHGYPIKYSDITAGKRYGVHLWNIVGNVASSPKVFVVFPDGHSPANIQIDDSGVDNGAMSATVVVPDDAVRIQVYLAKDENAEYASADFALVDLDKTVTGNIEKRLSAIESTYTPSLWNSVTNVVMNGSYASVSNGEVFQYQNVVAGNRYKVHLWDIVGNSSATNPRIYILSPDGNIEIKYSGVVDGELHVPVIVPQGATAIRVYMNKHADAPFASANYALVDEGVAFVGNKLTCKIFKRVVCCGDSFTSGYIKLDASTVSETNEEYAWPHYLSTMTGNEWLNCGQHGKTVLSWPTAARGLPKAQTLGTAQAYVIGLMINDARQTGGVPAVPVGTASDIGTDNPTTYYGGLAKIIRELNAISPRAKIFVNTIPEINPIYTDYNTAVRTVVNTYAGMYPVHCIDLYEYRNLYNIPSLTGDKLNSHYTALGYEQFAEIYAYILSDYINTHISAFQDVYSLPYEGDGDVGNA